MWVRVGLKNYAADCRVHSEDFTYEYDYFDGTGREQILVGGEWLTWATLLKVFT